MRAYSAGSARRQPQRLPGADLATALTTTSGKTSRIPKTAMAMPQVRKRWRQTGVMSCSTEALTTALSKESETSSTDEDGGDEDHAGRAGGGAGVVPADRRGQRQADGGDDEGALEVAQPSAHGGRIIAADGRGRPEEGAARMRAVAPAPCRRRRPVVPCPSPEEATVPHATRRPPPGRPGPRPPGRRAVAGRGAGRSGADAALALARRGGPASTARARSTSPSATPWSSTGPGTAASGSSASAAASGSGSTGWSGSSRTGGRCRSPRGRSTRSTAGRSPSGDVPPLAEPPAAPTRPSGRRC